jgi:hypothetical protein
MGESIIQYVSHIHRVQIGEYSRKLFQLDRANVLFGNFLSDRISSIL